MSTRYASLSTMGVIDRIKKTAGFTLLEILVALAVVAIALSAIVTETSTNVKNAARLRDKTLAHWVAMNRASEWHAREDWPAPGTTRGEELMADHEWHWTMTVSTTDDADVRRMDVEVRADQNAGKPDAALIAYIGKPTQ